MRQLTLALCRGSQPVRSILSFAPYGAAAGAALLWSGNYVVTKAVLPLSSPLELAFWRWTITFVVLLPFAAPVLWRTRNRLKGMVARGLLPAAVGVAGANTCLYFALEGVASLDTLVAASAKPIAIALLVALLSGRILGPRHVIGAALPAIGVALIATQGAPSALSDTWSPAAGWLFANVALFALYSVLLARGPREQATVSSFTAMVGLGTLMLMPFYIFDAALRGFTLPRREALMAAAYLGVGASALAYVLWNWSLQRLGAAEAGPFLHLVPAAGVLEAVVMLGEPPQPYHVYGALGIAAGMGIFAFGRLRHATPLIHSAKGNPSATPPR